MFLPSGFPLFWDQVSTAKIHIAFAVVAAAVVAVPHNITVAPSVPAALVVLVEALIVESSQYHFLIST
ncbi:hypothetical protein RF20_11205 [Salmonella enterica]|nr:hypothetical protein [Salmonella enterica]ECH8207440.1 hypothetical protein [Salmonella enterica subsp. enterica]